MAETSNVVRAIKEEMKRQDLSVQQLAERAGIGFPNLYAIFAGETSPTIATVEKLTKALKLKLMVGIS